MASSSYLSHSVADTKDPDQIRRATERRGRRRRLAAGLAVLNVLLVAMWLYFGATSIAQAANPDGALRIEINTAYNLVVDSNAESPSTYAPGAFYIGARICNDGLANLTDVVAYAGNFDEVGTNHTPGVYPARTHPTLVGTFSLTHEGGDADATRNIGTLPAGKCVMQYWLASYPSLDDAGTAVHRPSIKPDDDLWLQYDVWATADDGVQTRQANQTTTVHLRNEISAMANKIWPNGDNKVPDAYRQAINEVVGWDTSTASGGSSAYPGEVISTHGIWYDLGNVGKGFDNNGDFIPDQNAWMQPVGDPALYDASCFRLVHTYGIVIVKLKGGGELLIPFEDQLYFEGIPDNTGVVGLVFYDFVALNGACTASMTPYQEVASGADNEKFNGDFGHFVPPLTSLDPAVAFDKQVDKTLIGPIYPERLTYSLAFTNTGPVDAGTPTYNLPLVVRDSIPAGTTYVTGSAGATVDGGAIDATILFSDDNGTTWSATEPAAATVTDIQWWLDAALPPGAAGVATFQIDVPGSYNAVAVPNTGGLGFGTANPFADDTVYTILKGTSTIGDLVWQDDDNSGTYDSGSESSIDGVTVTLYWDQNGNGELDETDLLVSSQDTVGGSYTFTELPAGDFLVVVAASDPAIPHGYTPTTAEVIAVPALSGAYADADFGFGPPLTMSKTAVTSPIYEGQAVSYTINVTNHRESSLGAPCQVMAWATALAYPQTDGKWLMGANAVGANELDGLFANSDFQAGNESLAGTLFDVAGQTDNIVSVEAVFSLYLGGGNAVLNNDIVTARVYFNDDTNAVATQQLATSQLNALAPGPTNQGTIAWDVTAARTWHWADFSGNLDLELNTDKVNADDNTTLFLDGLGFRITTDQTCGGNKVAIMETVPVSDVFDADLLHFVSANPPATSVSLANTPYANTGVINWANVGPIDGQQTVTVTVSFVALEPPGNGSVPITNTASASGATFFGGNPVNSAVDYAVGTLLPTGSISGTLWSEGAGGSSGWIDPTTGYESGVDLFIPGATVTLYACLDSGGNLIYPGATSASCESTGGSGNNGIWTAVDTQITDSNGDYAFVGLLDGYYYVAVDNTTITGSVTQTGDPDDLSGVCSVCDDTWTDPVGDLSTVGEIAGAASVGNVNFGYDVPPSITGSIWQDFDGDGVQDVGDTGIVTPTVTLIGSDGANITVSVDAAGNYQFGDLVPGVTYTVTVNIGTLPGSDPWTQTAESDGTTNNQIVLTPAAGQILTNNDFGFQQTGTAVIGDTLFYDWNGDGDADAGDEGIPDVTVALYADNNGNGVYDAGVDALVTSTTTGLTGFYQFDQLPAGDYVVAIDTNDPDFPAGLAASADPDEAGACATCDHQGAATGVASGSTTNTLDFGYQPFGNGSLGDTVFFDQNGDGLQSGPGETGLGGVVVELWADPNGDGIYTLALTTTTMADGSYVFDNLPDGSYQVMVDNNDPVIQASNYLASTPTSVTTVLNNGAVNSIDGNPCTACGDDIDFGFMPLGSIGDLIFWDDNGNGEPDFGDAGIGGVQVTLTNASTQTITVDGVDYAPGATIATTLTSDGSDGNPVGAYLFDGLPPADYTVSVDPSASPINNATQTADPDRDGVACDDNTYPTMPPCDDATTVTLLPGTNFMGADLGYQPSGVVGDFVWFDQNGDGVQDATEIGLPGLVVTITNGIDTFTTTTDFNGEYSFSQLGEGVWTLTIEQPATMSPTAGPESLGANTATVTLAGGAVTQINGAPCANCDLDADLGFTLNGPYTLNGSICLEDTATTTAVGACDVGDSDVGGQPVYLYNDAGDYLGSTTTDANGVYTYTNLIDDIYYVAVGNRLAPLDNTALTTTVANTPANSSNPGTPVSTISGSAVSNYQVVAVNSTTAGADNLVLDVDFAYESTVDMDFGDLPGFYSATELGDDGPRHILPASPTLYLGAAPDSEPDGAPSAAADADEDDGVATPDLSTWSDGANGGSVSIDIVGDGYLVGWIDFNGDGDFLDPDETIIATTVTTSSGQSFTFDIPDGTCNDSCVDNTLTFYARFRLFEEAPLLPQFAYAGSTTGGEVEDYQWQYTGGPPTAVALRGLPAGGRVATSPLAWLAGLALLALTASIVMSRRPRGC